MSTLKVSLIPFNNEHVTQTYEWVRDPELRRMFLMRGEPTPAGHQEYFKKTLADPTQRVYVILFQGAHVGNCGIKNISLPKKEGELWIYIGDAAMRGKGISKAATELSIQEGFGRLGLKMLYVHVAEFNTVAQGLYKGLGFKEVPLSGNDGAWTDREGKILRMELRKT